jgi:uncharacterized protein
VNALLRILVLAVILGAGSLASPQSVAAAPDVATGSKEVAIPPLTARITDLTGTLSTAQIQSLEQTLLSFEARKGSQIAVLMVPTTQPETIEQFGIRVADQWKLGRKGVDDGAILIVAKDDRALRIEVGYGLEGVLNDATSKRIVSEIIVPRFRDGDFAGGIRDGVDRMIQVIEGEPLPATDSNSASSRDVHYYVPMVVLFALLLGSYIRRSLGRVPSALVTGGVLGLLAWLVAQALSVALISALIAFAVTLIGGSGIWSLLSVMARGRNGRTGAGGFRGGGGGFGGGGASGRW